MFVSSRRNFLKAAGLGAPAMALSGCLVKDRSGRFRTFTLAERGNLRLPVPGLKAPVKFFVAGDTHFAMADQRDEPYRDNYARMAKNPGTPADFEKMLASAKEGAVDLVCLVGDIISFPTLANVEYVERTLKASGVKWLYTAGNHDWHFEGLPGSDIEQRAEWTEKRLKPLYQGANALYSSKVVKGVRFVAIDNSVYHVTKEQLAFYRQEAAKPEPIVLLMHIPLWTEGFGVFSCGSPMWGAKIDPYWEIERREKWAEKQCESTFIFRDEVLATPHLAAVFTGHIHQFMVAHTPEDQLMFTVPQNRTGARIEVEALPLA